MNPNDHEIQVRDMVGMTLKSITVAPSKDEIIFESESGRKFKMYHQQDCCESVLVEDICGDLEDLIGTKIVVAEEVSNNYRDPNGSYDSQTWTFYKFRTSKGSVTIRWLGHSNGYYSERVDFCETSTT